MTVQITLTGTEQNAVRLTISMMRDFWQGPEDFSGVIIQNKVSAAAMLSTSQVAQAGDLANPSLLTEVQYAALQTNGKPSDAVLVWLNTKITQGLRGHVLNFETARALNALALNGWNLT